MMNAAGVHLLGGHSTFPRGKSGLRINVSRIRHDSTVAATVQAPGELPRIDTNDLHVALLSTPTPTLAARLLAKCVLRFMGNLLCVLGVLR